MQYGFDDGIRLGCLYAGKHSHNRHLQLRQFYWDAQRRNLVPARLGIEKFAVFFETPAEIDGLRHAHFIHPDGNQVGAEFLAVKLDIQQPVVLLRFIGYRAVNQIIALGVVLVQQFFDSEMVASGQRNNLHAVNLNLVQFINKFPVLVLPYDNAPLVEFRQRLRKSSGEVLLYFFGVHFDMSPVSLSFNYPCSSILRLSSSISRCNSSTVGSVRRYFEAKTCLASFKTEYFTIASFF